MDDIDELDGKSSCANPRALTFRRVGSPPSARGYVSFSTRTVTVVVAAIRPCFSVFPTSFMMRAPVRPQSFWSSY